MADNKVYLQEIFRADIMPEVNPAIYDVHDLLICTLCHRNTLIHGLLHGYENPMPLATPSVVILTYVTCYRCCAQDFGLAYMNRFIDEQVARTRYTYLLIQARTLLNAMNMVYRNLDTPTGFTVRLIMDVLPVLRGRDYVVALGAGGLEPRPRGFLGPDLEEVY